MFRKEGLASATITVTGLTVASAAGLGATAIAVARALGPEGRGEFAASHSLSVLLMTAGGLGIGLGGRRLLATGAVHPGDYLRLALRLALLTALASTLLAPGLLPLFDTGVSWSLVAAIAVGAGAALVVTATREALIGVGRSADAARLTAVATVAVFGGSMLLIWVGSPTAPDFLWVYAIVTAAEALAGARVLQRAVVPFATTRVDSDRALLRAGRPALVLLLAQSVATRGDRLVIGAIAGAENLGLYAVAITAMELLSIGALSLGAVAFRSMAVDELGRQPMGRARRVVLLVTATGALITVMTAAPLVRLAFGDEFSPAVPALRLLAVAAIPYGSLLLDSQQLLAKDHTAHAALLHVFAAAAVILGDLLVVPKYGLVGAAWVSVCAYSVVAVAAARRLSNLGRS